MTLIRGLMLFTFFCLGVVFYALADKDGSDEGSSAESTAVASATGSSGEAEAQPALPADAEHALERLNSSPRHGEWVTVTEGADTVKSWVVYPERPDNAPVVVVVHEIFGLTHWVRAVADQMAAEGFIAIAPDLMTTYNLPEGPDGPERDAATSTIRTLDPDVVQRQISLVADYAMQLPAAQQTYGVVGFCWGGSTVFNHAVAAPNLGASVVYYGTSPATETLASVQAPVLGMYGGDDARVNSTIPTADSALSAMGKRYEPVIFDGAGHGFLRAQGGRDGANLLASQAAWPQTVAFFREMLETP
jgi:carboxymethylenebutenolidase